MEHQRATKSAQKEQSKTPSSSLHQIPLNHVAVYPLLDLQRTIGNQAVQTLPYSGNVQSNATIQAFRELHFRHDFSQIPIRSTQPAAPQTKLTINQPGDAYEQEADQVAEQVMRMTGSQTSVSDDEDGAKKFLMREQGGEPQASVSTESLDVPPIVNAVLSSGSGQPLDITTRAFMEPRFGHDFSQVRVHTNSQAAESASAIRAEAYAVGRDIFFGREKYNPAISEGKRLLAHELTHVVQHTGAIRRAPVRDERKRAEADSLYKRVKESLQKNTTLTGAKIDITPSLMVLIEPRLSKLPIRQDDRSKAIYKEFRGEAFVQGGNRSKNADELLLDFEDVDINDVRQGHLGDCYLFAAMAAIAQANPQAIRDLIHKNDDGTYDVKLYIYNSKWQPHRTPVIMKKIKPLFPSWKKSGKSAYGHASEGEDVGDMLELWPMLIEKAYAYYRSGYDMIQIQAGRDVEDMIPMLVKGVTKWDTKSYDPGDKDQTEETIVATITQALEKNMAVTAGSKDEKTMPKEEQRKTASYEYSLDRDDHPGVHPNHNYVPTRISKQSIDLYNPWGSAHLRNLPISLFRECFDIYTITKLPLPKSSVKKE